MAELTDEELSNKDVVELINTFINRSLNKSVTVKRRGTKKQVNPDGLCYIVTRGRASSRAEDLAHFVSVEESNRVYN